MCSGQVRVRRLPGEVHSFDAMAGGCMKSLSPPWRFLAHQGEGRQFTYSRARRVRVGDCSIHPDNAERDHRVG